MYENLIKSLRDKADFLNKTDYDRNAPNSFADAMKQAADAIEEMQAGEKKFLRNISALETENENLKRGGRWIPVTERLPSGYRNVLAAFDDVIVVAFYSNHEWMELATYSVFFSTHWMPLPTPPKEET